MGIFQLELHLASALFDQVIQEQRGQVIEVFVGRMCAQVQDSRHGIGLAFKIYQASLSLIDWPHHNDPKEGEPTAETASFCLIRS
jgi:hypothetical protein